MNSYQKQRKNILNNHGSLSVEAAIVMPFFMLICMFLLYILQGASAYTRMNRAVCKSAEVLGAYAQLYHTHGIQDVEDKLLSHIKKTGYDGEDSTGILREFINLRTLSDVGDDLAYSVLVKKLYMYFYERDEYFNGAITESEEISFLGSEFFNDRETITLRASANIKPAVPLPEGMFPKIKIHTEKTFKCWIYGRQNTRAVITMNVWEMDNLSRGKYLRSVFGANLQEFYPVVAIYSGGSVTMIKSLDFTGKYYQSGTQMKKEIKSMLYSLNDFNGTDNEKYKDYTPVIHSNDIRSKRLLLIIPTNEQNEKQVKAMMEMAALAGSMNIKFEVQTYGESTKNMIE